MTVLMSHRSHGPPSTNEAAAGRRSVDAQNRWSGWRQWTGTSTPDASTPSRWIEPAPLAYRLAEVMVELTDVKSPSLARHVNEPTVAWSTCAEIVGWYAHQSPTLIDATDAPARTVSSGHGASSPSAAAACFT